MANMILVEGPDNSGKSTFIKSLVREGFTLLEFPKKTSEGKFKCVSVNEVAIFLTMCQYLDPSKVYVLDRGMLSNIVYDGIVPGNDELIRSMLVDLLKFTRENNVFVVPLTRNNIDFDFEDDLIKLPKDKFNSVVAAFDSLYSELHLESDQLLDHDAANNLITSHTQTAHELIRLIKRHFGR